MTVLISALVGEHICRYWHISSWLVSADNIGKPICRSGPCKNAVLVLPVCLTWFVHTGIHILIKNANFMDVQIDKFYCLTQDATCSLKTIFTENHILCVWVPEVLSSQFAFVKIAFWTTIGFQTSCNVTKSCLVGRIVKKSDLMWAQRHFPHLQMNVMKSLVSSPKVP